MWLFLLPVVLLLFVRSYNRIWSTHDQINGAPLLNKLKLIHKIAESLRLQNLLHKYECTERIFHIYINPTNYHANLKERRRNDRKKTQNIKWSCAQCRHLTYVPVCSPFLQQIIISKVKWKLFLMTDKWWACNWH